MEWSDWFSGSPQNTISGVYSSPIPLIKNTQILFCIFIDIVSSITLTSQEDITLYLDECSFIDCYRNGNGGSIVFNQGSNCVLSKVCAYQCNTTNGYSGQFCHIRVQTGSQYQNIAHLVSVCKCAQYENSDRFWSISFCCGNISLKNMNSSHNRCYIFSGLYLEYPSISDTMQSTYSNNTDDSSRCICYYGNSHFMSQCNILKNHQKTIDWGTLYIAGLAITNLSGCIINMNTGAGNIVYVYTQSSVTLQNCYLQVNMDTYGNVNIQFHLSDSQSLPLIHFHSQMCLTLIHNEIDDANPLTSNLNTITLFHMFNIFVIMTHLITIS